jgi:hypothetical protein
MAGSKALARITLELGMRSEDDARARYIALEHLA